MLPALRVLIAEDNPDDAELIVRQLRRADFAVEWERVDTEPEYVARLRPELDVILSDYAMPQFSGPRALELLRERGLDVPFIIISGTIGEDTAVAAMKLGAADYLIKDRLTRLGPAISQAIEQARLRRERRQAADELRLFRALVDQSDDTFEVIDPATGRFLDVNERGCLDLGYSRAEHLALRVFEVEVTLSAAEWADLVDRIRVNGSWCGDGWHQRKDGTTFPVEVNARWVSLDRDYIVAVVRDVTERRRAEARLRELAAMLDQAHDAIIVRGLQDRRITYWNCGAEQLYGWTSEEALGRDIGELIFVDPAMPDRVTAKLLEAEEWRGEQVHRSKTGRELTVRCHATRAGDRDAQQNSVLVINFDITEQKKLEAQMLRAQRMESIGTLAAGVAHDLNNILSPIMMSAPLLRGNLPEVQRASIVETIEKCAARGAQIVRQVLAFGRGVEVERRPLQIGELINEVRQIIGETFPRNIAIEALSDPGLWPVVGDSTQLHQVLLNLAVNARDAMPSGGSLRLQARNLFVDKSYASMLSEAKIGPHVQIEVADTGSGIPAEILERIFDPFFTTKSHGHGTGLGLATAFGIVRSHGGFITVSSSPAQGAQFQVVLPASPEKLAGAGMAPAESGPPRASGETVLLVDDEAEVRRAAEQALLRHGYAVLSAADGVEALAIFATNSARVAGVLTDLLMPNMDGLALIRALNRMRPGLPIIAMTGVGEEAVRVELHSLKIAAVLDKPFGAEAMLRAVHEAFPGTVRSTPAAPSPEP